MTTPPSRFDPDDAHPGAVGRRAPLRIPPPNNVRLAGIVVAFQALALAAYGVAGLVSGIGHDADMAQLVAQTIYFLVIGAGLLWVAAALLRGLRRGRTPAIVVQVVVVMIGMWAAFPASQLRWGLAVIVVGGVTFALLVTRPARDWVAQFPAPFWQQDDQ